MNKLMGLFFTNDGTTPSKSEKIAFAGFMFVIDLVMLAILIMLVILAF